MNTPNKIAAQLHSPQGARVGNSYPNFPLPTRQLYDSRKIMPLYFTRDYTVDGKVLYLKGEEFNPYQWNYDRLAKMYLLGLLTPVGDNGLKLQHVFIDEAMHCGSLECDRGLIGTDGAVGKICPDCLNIRERNYQALQARLDETDEQRQDKEPCEPWWAGAQSLKKWEDVKAAHRAKQIVRLPLYYPHQDNQVIDTIISNKREPEI